MRIFSFGAILSLILPSLFAFNTLFAQNEQVLVSPEGMRYIHHKKTGGKKAEPNGVTKIHFLVLGTTHAGKDTLLMDTWKSGTMPLPAEVDKTPFKDVMYLVSAGDSVTVLVPTAGMPGTEFAKPGSDIRYVVKFFDMMSRADYEAEARAGMEKSRKEQEVMRAKMIEEAKNSPLGVQQDQTIQNYLAEKKLTAVKLDAGMYIVFEEKGAGEKVKPGDNVSVHYTGYLLDGTKFDSSHDRNQPIPVTVAMGQVIKGWDLGLQEFHRGGKGKLIIPSYLAYGERGAGNIITPNSILVFDIEILN
jgi:FKBP-type peptidyl-prolyl cis-trans isomerase